MELECRFGACPCDPLAMTSLTGGEIPSPGFNTGVRHYLKVHDACIKNLCGRTQTLA